MAFRSELEFASPQPFALHTLIDHYRSMELWQWRCPVDLNSAAASEQAALCLQWLDILGIAIDSRVQTKRLRVSSGF